MALNQTRLYAIGYNWFDYSPQTGPNQSWWGSQWPVLLSLKYTSSKNMVSGLLKVLMPNVKGSSVNLGELIVVAAIFFLHSPILHHKNLNSKNSSPCEDTFATSIRSITVSSTLLSNIGGHPSIDIIQRLGPQTLRKWRRMSSWALMMSHCCRFISMSHFCYSIHIVLITLL